MSPITVELNCKENTMRTSMKKDNDDLHLKVLVFVIAVVLFLILVLVLW